MDGPVFDAMLKNALEEALQEDLRELEKTPPPPVSLRQRRRMRRMLADPWRYARRLQAEEAEAPPPRRKRNPARWLLVAVIAALLAGTAAGYALRGGDFFRQMFEESPWAAEYGEAADTEQLLDMGGGNVGSVLEDDHFRLELLDAVSEGENAMAAVRITVKDMGLLERTFGRRTVAPGLFLRQDGSFFESGSSGTQYVYPDMDDSLADNQFMMIFRTDRNRATEGRKYTLTFHDFGYYDFEDRASPAGREVLLIPGNWTLELELSFDGGTVVEKAEAVQLESCAFTVDRVRVSSLSVGMTLHCGFAEVETLSDVLKDAVIRMEDGTEVPHTGYRFAGGGEDEAGFACEILYEFGMPLEREEISAIVIQGHEISLSE
ncbi:hypothetical protein [uncultured Oscillibacter sp.]|uniref:hypothetical protein n=1 Tax=uncultured Oscillibacter sp. TaxID=876091 RepID=UPI0025FDB48A|nr:hypothetical protein [uncultured Oscillibacter sp.]